MSIMEDEKQVQNASRRFDHQMRRVGESRSERKNVDSAAYWMARSQDATCRALSQRTTRHSCSDLVRSDDDSM